MARIAAIEEADSIRDEEDVEAAQNLQQSLRNDDKTQDADEQMDETADSTNINLHQRVKYIATPLEIQEAFESINTLRYSQPTHLQGSLFS